MHVAAFPVEMNNCLSLSHFAVMLFVSDSWPGQESQEHKESVCEVIPLLSLKLFVGVRKDVMSWISHSRCKDQALHVDLRLEDGWSQRQAPRSGGSWQHRAALGSSPFALGRAWLPLWLSGRLTASGGNMSLIFIPSPVNHRPFL